MAKSSTTSSRKTKAVCHSRVPPRLWRLLKKHLPKQRRGGVGQPPKPNRAVFDGIWYVLWTGCQWKSIRKEWFGVSSSTLHSRFQAWTKAGVFSEMFGALQHYYNKMAHIQWQWQSADSCSCPSPLGGAGKGKNPTDRGKLGAKIHILVDQRGAPLSIIVSGANQNDVSYLTALIFALLLERPGRRQHLCADKGYDSVAVELAVQQQGYTTHIKHRQWASKAKSAPTDANPLEPIYPPRRWVAEALFAKLRKRRSLRTCWCKKLDNWLSLVQLACTDVLLAMSQA